MKNLIIKKITSILLPFMLMYGFYVLLHGHTSPGGGFAGGAILGTSLVFFTIVFGHRAGERFKPRLVLMFMVSTGALTYIVLGLSGIVSGGNFLSNDNLPFNLGLLLETAIGLVVASVLFSLFLELTREE